MDVVLESLDESLLDALYPSAWPRDALYRQIVSLFLTACLGSYVLYFVTSTVSYFTLFDRSVCESHPLWLERQVRREIGMSVKGIPVMAALTVPWFVGEVRGWSRLYRKWPDREDTVGWGKLLMGVVGFLLFTDMCVYWIHRWEHHPRIYHWLHKPHHLWKVPSPFSAMAFHPLDGYAQSIPYHLFIFLVPLHSVVYLALFVFVQIWTIGIHDGSYLINSEVVNGCAHHTVHHLQFHYNYGQYLTLWDRIGGSYRRPLRESTIRQRRSFQAQQPSKLAYEESLQKRRRRLCSWPWHWRWWSATPSRAPAIPLKEKSG